MVQNQCHLVKFITNSKDTSVYSQNCAYKFNDDRIGAMNLYRMGINYLSDSQSTKESNDSCTVATE